MRAGAYTIHQSLTAEAAAVLKLALALARRRGHAQVTPLHVAFALLTGPTAAASCAQPLAAAFFSASSSPAAPYGLLKRACLRSHPSPGAAASSPAQQQQHHHPLQCRALELCFNVALNRLPTSGPHSPPAAAAHFASPLIQPSPTLSNALVAALKRAQANQRRGCVELQQTPPPPPPVSAQQQQQQPQPLLAIKVELDQLVISILDDPSVSRVMREAGFSSATVKSNLEEESALMPPPSSSSSSPPPPPPPIPPHFFLDPSIAAAGGGRSGGGRLALWPAQFLAAAPGPDACSDDVRAVLEVMVRRQGRRGGGNPVVVGDSVSMAEAVAGELLRRLERGDVPAELAGAHLLKLQLSYVHVRLMSRADVDAHAAELRRSVDDVQPQRGGGLVVYVGDLRWALDEEPNPSEHATASSYSPVEHMVAELGRLLDDLRASRGRSWLVATASYQTYMRWQQRRRRPPTESAAWALQAVVVPTGSGTGLALNSLHPSTPSSSSSLPSASAGPVPPAMATAQQLGQSPFVMAAGETTGFPAAGDDQDETHLPLCTECSKNYEREASLVKAEAGAEGPRGSLPAWLVPDRPPVGQTPHHHKEKYLMELKKKWSRLCRKLHLCAVDPCSAPCPWWSGSGPCLLPGSQNQSKPTAAGFLGLDGLMELGKSRTSQWPPSSLPRCGLTPVMAPGCQGAGTALALGSHPLSDSATSGGRAPGSGDGYAAVRELERRLRRNIPWQPVSVVAEIVETALAGRGPVWMYVKGSDHAAARRAAAVIAEARCGSSDRVVLAHPSRFSCAEELCADVVSRASGIGGQAFVVVVDDVENAPCDVMECLVATSERGRLKDHQSGRELDLSSSVVILTTSKLTGAAGSVIGLRLWSEDEAPPGGALKRKTVSSPQGECKWARHDALDLNLNICAEEDTDDEEDDEEAIPSDITHEGDSGDSSEHGHPHGLLESIAARVVTLDEEGGHDAAAAIRARLAGAIAGQGRSRVDEAAVQALAAASGEFLEEVLERWTAEVLGPAAATVRNGGKGQEVVVLGLGPVGGAREAEGFMGSVLPSRVHVD